MPNRPALVAASPSGIAACSRFALVVLLAGGCAEGSDCREYPTRIALVAFGPDWVQVAGLAGNDPIDCADDPGAGGFRTTYRDNALHVEDLAFEAEFVDGYGYVYAPISFPNQGFGNVGDVRSPRYRVELWHPESTLSLRIESVYNPEHDLHLTFLGEDGAVLAEALME